MARAGRVSSAWTGWVGFAGIVLIVIGALRALTVLALNVVVFYALTVRWDEAKRGLGGD